MPELWEVFVRPKSGTDFRHCGSVRAAGPALAKLAARDLYTRRHEAISIWVVKSADIHALDPNIRDVYFTSPGEHPERYAEYYSLPDGVEDI